MLTCLPGDLLSSPGFGEVSSASTRADMTCSAKMKK